METGSIRIGTSGWSYKHWRGRFYASGVRPADYLSHYASLFSCTEINASFYGTPTHSTVEKWSAAVPDGFRFCPKMSRFLTHVKRLKEPEEPLERFFTALVPLSQKLGPVLIQLPPNLAFDFQRAETLFVILSSRYREHAFVLEVRHMSWLDDAALDLMAQHRVGLVISQSGAGFPYSEMVTATTIYLRFHGPGALYASQYTDEQLAAYALKMAAWQREGHAVWAFFNNDIHGYAVEDAQRLATLVKQAGSDSV